MRQTRPEFMQRNQSGDLCVMKIRGRDNSIKTMQATFRSSTDFKKLVYNGGSDTSRNKLRSFKTCVTWLSALLVGKASPNILTIYIYKRKIYKCHAMVLRVLCFWITVCQTLMTKPVEKRWSGLFPANATFLLQSKQITSGSSTILHILEEVDQ